MASTSTGGSFSFSTPSIPKPAAKPPMKTVTVRGAGGIDASQFKGLARALKAAQPEMRLALLRNLKAIGEVVANDARVIAGDYSTTIPSTIKTQVRGESVRVRGGGGGVAIAGLFELGNTGGSKSARAASNLKFRHPVYGKWVSGGSWDGYQDMHPFLAPALEKNRATITALTVQAMDEAIKVIVHG